VKHSEAMPKQETSSLSAGMGWLLGLPLVIKLVGANVLIALAAVGALATSGAPLPNTSEVIVYGVTLIIGAIISVALIALALHPLRDLEQVSQRVSGGDFNARVEPSLLADKDVARIGTALNRLLDSVVSDRARLRQLAAEVVDSGDRERAQIARGLHESSAQSLAALMMHLGALVRRANDGELSHQLVLARQLAADVLEEVRALASFAHPHVVDEVGLAQALENLAVWARQPDVEVLVNIQGDLQSLPSSVTTMLYRAAQEALSSALRDRTAASIAIQLTIDDSSVTLEVLDDGDGLDGQQPTDRRRELTSVQQRVTLAEGQVVRVSGTSARNLLKVVIPLSPDSMPVYDQPAISNRLISTSRR
jgi:signal transduction histidine kinase